ncbi:Kynurenine--oxoglutarate transaminase [Glycine soja]|uniref:Kynurenine--oxoglutarate transaminase n=1 Tax=Glycine soja TaxID=3848 RepID=A0A0B2RFQ7_GLYSO|nr:Kynurenine--oxoglutarate transaminase [Glycine soja]
MLAPLIISSRSIVPGDDGSCGGGCRYWGSSGVSGKVGSKQSAPPPHGGFGGGGHLIITGGGGDAGNGGGGDVGCGGGGGSSHSLHIMRGTWSFPTVEVVVWVVVVDEAVVRRKIMEYKLAQRCNAINLAEGFPAPPHLKNAAVSAIISDSSQYRHVQGVCDLLAKIVKQMHGLDIDPLKDVAICCGQSEAFAAAIFATLDPGDEVILFDPSYETYEGCVVMTGGSFPGMQERTIITSSLPKSFSVTGWRVGWAIAPAFLASAIRNIDGRVTDYAPAPFQEAALTALRSPPEYFESLRRDYQSKRDYIIKLLGGVGFKIEFIPQDSFFLFAELPDNCPLSDKDWASFWMLQGILRFTKVGDRIMERQL